MRAILVSLFSLICFSVSIHAIEPEWSSLTSQKQINKIIVVDNKLYAATTGGLLVITDQTQAPTLYGGLDGLGTTIISDLMVDAQDELWLAGTGRLVKFDPVSSEQYLFLDNQNNLIELFSITNDNDLVWVGSELGLILFSKTIDGGQIQDSYQLFGGLNPDVSVNDVVLQGDSIYLATAEGLAIADRSNVNLLKSPTAWTTYGPSQLAVLNNGVRSIELYNNYLYIAATDGLYRLNLTTRNFSLTSFNIASGGCYDLTIRNDSLFVYCDNGLGIITSSNSTIYTLSNLSGAPVTGTMFDELHWVGTSDNGLAYLSDGIYQSYPYLGAPSNRPSDLAVSPDGTIFAGFAKDPFGKFTVDGWTEIIRSELNTSIDVMVDSLGRGFIGTWGGGLYMIDGDQVTNFTRHNSSLTGNSDGSGEDYEVIRGLDNDGRYLFAGVYRSLTDQPIAIADLNNLSNLSGWMTLGAADGLTNHFVSSIDYHNGWLAVGTDAAGLFVYYLGPDPFDKSDDSVMHYTKNSDNLASDKIQSVKYAPDGTLYVATNQGVSLWNIGYERFDDVTLPGTVGPNIAALETDSRGNIWIGGVNGLGRINTSTLEGEHFTQLNSGLLANEVKRIQYHSSSGRVYLATSGGISIVESLLGPQTEDTNEGYPFPNPFVIRTSTDQLNFTYAESGQVRIYTVAGELIAEQSVNVGWDGTNQAGQRVASGVYLYIYSSDSGVQHQGKFVLVND